MVAGYLANHYGGCLPQSPAPVCRDTQTHHQMNLRRDMIAIATVEFHHHCGDHIPSTHHHPKRAMGDLHPDCGDSDLSDHPHPTRATMDLHLQCGDPIRSIHPHQTTMNPYRGTTVMNLLHYYLVPDLSGHLHPVPREIPLHPYP